MRIEECSREISLLSKHTHTNTQTKQNHSTNTHLFKYFTIWIIPPELGFAGNWTFCKQYNTNTCAAFIKNITLDDIIYIYITRSYQSNSLINFKTTYRKETSYQSTKKIHFEIINTTFPVARFNFYDEKKKKNYCPLKINNNKKII